MLTTDFAWTTYIFNNLIKWQHQTVVYVVAIAIHYLRNNRIFFNRELNSLLLILKIFCCRFCFLCPVFPQFVTFLLTRFARCNSTKIQLLISKKNSVCCKELYMLKWWWFSFFTTLGNLTLYCFWSYRQRENNTTCIMYNTVLNIYGPKFMYVLTPNVNWYQAFKQQGVE